MVHVLPGDSNGAATAQPPGDPTEHTRPLPPHSGATQDLHDFQRPTGVAFERQVVDVPTPPSLGVEELVIDDVQTDVDKVAQFWPTLVRIISGIAASETIRITTR